MSPDNITLAEILLAVISIMITSSGVGITWIYYHRSMRAVWERDNSERRRANEENRTRQNVILTKLQLMISHHEEKHRTHTMRLDTQGVVLSKHENAIGMVDWRLKELEKGEKI